MARRSKYDPKTFPDLVESYARDGLLEKDMAKLLGVSHNAFNNYKNNYSEFKEAIKRGKAPVDFQVENALLKRALGYDYEEETIEYENVNNKPAIKRKKTIKKHIPPDTGAAFIWLKNRKSKYWKQNPIDKDEDRPKQEITISEETIRTLNKVLDENY